MSGIVVKKQSNAEIVEQVVIGGDLSRLTAEQRITYYRQVCESVGLNPLTQPLEYITLNHKLVLYARKAATDQLRKNHNVAIKIKTREAIGDLYIVTALASMAGGREDEAMGVVVIAGLSGVDLANAYMKCETKAKRRATLSICGLSLPDETEIDDIPAKDKATVFPEQPGEGDGVKGLGPYTVTYGAERGRTLEEVYKKLGHQGMISWFRRIEDLPNRTDQWRREHTPELLELMERAADFLGEKESAFDPNGPSTISNGSTDHR